MATHYRRFRDISVSERLLDSLFLITIGIGYLFAIAHTYYSHSSRDGRPGLSIEDVRIAYYGSQDHTQLAAAINGSMGSNLKSVNDKKTIISWLEAGKSKDTFEKNVAPILNRDCIFCHSPDTNPSIPNLTNYQGVIETSQGDGTSLPALVRVSHIHLFGIAFILFFTGKIFILCNMNVTLKRTIVVIPFLTMLIDILSWIPARTIPEFAYVVVGAGAMMGLSMGIQIIVSLYQMWVHPLHPKINMSPSDQARLNDVYDTLHTYSYEITPENEGWLVKESLRSWQYLHSLNELEAYIEEVKSRHQSD